jgi:tetratricopeptide (TPR) repeat protein
MGERLIYHSSVGFCLCVAWLLCQWAAKITPAAYAQMGLVILVLLLVVLSGVKTVNRNQDWESNSTLYRKDVVTASNSAITNGNAGLSYLNEAPLQYNENARHEMLHQAMHYFNKAISIHPGYTFAYLNRGITFFEQGDLEHAKQDWDTAKVQFPDHPDLPGLYASYYINTSISLFGSKGNYEGAIAELQKGAALAPRDIIILFNLGYYYNLTGRKDAAISAFQKIIDLKPNDTLATKCKRFISILKKPV